MRRLLAAAIWLAAASGASAECVPPTPPDPATRPAKLVPPAKSACVDAKVGTPGCVGFEAYSYNDAVKAFNAKVPAYRAAAEAYVNKLNDYVKASSAYAQCEVKALQQ